MYLSPADATTFLEHMIKSGDGGDLIRCRIPGRPEAALMSTATTVTLTLTVPECGADELAGLLGSAAAKPVEDYVRTFGLPMGQLKAVTVGIAPDTIEAAHTGDSCYSVRLRVAVALNDLASHQARLAMA